MKKIFRFKVFRLPENAFVKLFLPSLNNVIVSPSRLEQSLPINFPKRVCTLMKIVFIKKSPRTLQRGRHYGSNNYSFKDKIRWDIVLSYWPCLTWKFSLWYGSIKFLNQFCLSSHPILKQLCWTLKKTSMDTFCGNFLILLEQ